MRSLAKILSFESALLLMISTASAQSDRKREMVADGKVYVGDEDGDVLVLQAGKVKKVLAQMNMGSAVYSTPVPAHGTLFLNNRNELFALAANGSTK